MIPLGQYTGVKDKYCISYYGNALEYLVQLRLLRPFMEAAHPGLKIYLACKDDALYLLENEERIVSKSQLNPTDFGYVRNISSNMRSHPVEDLLLESGINYGPICLECRGCPNSIYPKAMPPTRSLTVEEVKELEKLQGVVGVENVEVFEAAAKGLKTTLVATGVGTRLFQKMFPNAEIYRLQHT